MWCSRGCLGPPALAEACLWHVEQRGWREAPRMCRSGRTGIPQRALEQVDARRDRDGHRHTGVTRVAREQEDERGHDADTDRDEPRDAVQPRHERLLSRTDMTLTP